LVRVRVRVTHVARGRVRIWVRVRVRVDPHLVVQPLQLGAALGSVDHAVEAVVGAPG